MSTVTHGVFFIIIIMIPGNKKVCANSPNDKTRHSDAELHLDQCRGDAQSGHKKNCVTPLKAGEVSVQSNWRLDIFQSVVAPASVKGHPV